MALSSKNQQHTIPRAAWWFRRFAVSFAALIVTFCVPASAAEEGKLRIAVEQAYKPFSYIDDDGGRTGFDVEIVKALCVAMNRECELIPMPFDSILPAVAKGEIEVGALGFGVTPEREALVNFTERYFRSQSIFIEKPGSVKNTSLEEMTGKRVGVQPGSIQEEYLRKTYGSHIIPVPTPDFEQIFKNLQDGDSDIILVDGLPGYTVLKSPLGAGLETLGAPIPGDIVTTSAHMIVTKSRPQLREEINKAIQTIMRNGEYAKINRKYFEFSVY